MFDADLAPLRATQDGPPVFETLLYEERDGVAWVTLNRPEFHNAFDARMQLELEHVWRQLRRNDSVRVAVLTGAGDVAFCSGVDRTEALGGGVEGLYERTMIGNPSSSPFMLDDPGDRLGPKSNDLWKPVVAAVNGMAVGGAFYMLGECDIIIASENATFFDPHVTFGMTSSFETIQMAQRMPLGELARMQLLGNRERLSARRAYEIGLVSEVVPLPELPAAAGWVAEMIAAAPPRSVEGTVRAIWTAKELSRSQALAMGYAFVGMGNTPESLNEGQREFERGKNANWRGAWRTR